MPRVENASTVVASKNMSHLDNSIVQYLEPSFGKSDETDITPPITPEFSLNTDNDLMTDQLLLDQDMQPQPRYTNQQNEKIPQKKQNYIVPQEKIHRSKTVQAKIAKTELSRKIT